MYLRLKNISPQKKKIYNPSHCIPTPQPNLEYNEGLNKYLLTNLIPG